MSSGFLYIMINPTLRSNCYKIGKTYRSPEERARELSTGTGVAGNYEVAYQKYFEDVDTAEAAVHNHLRLSKINPKREFFDINLQEAIAAIEAVARGAPFNPPKNSYCVAPADRLTTQNKNQAEGSKVKGLTSSDGKKQEYLTFWTALIAEGNHVSQIWSNFVPKSFEWIRIPSGTLSAIDYYVIVNQSSIRFELFINTSVTEKNHAILDSLAAKKSEIEGEFPHRLEWKKFPKVAKIMHQVAEGCYREKSDWKKLITPTVNRFEPFWHAVQPRLKAIF